MMMDDDSDYEEKKKHHHSMVRMRILTMMMRMMRMNWIIMMMRNMIVRMRMILIMITIMMCSHRIIHAIADPTGWWKSPIPGVCFWRSVNMENMHSTKSWQQASTSIWIRRIHPSKSNALIWNVPDNVPNMCSPEFRFQSSVVKPGSSQFCPCFTLLHFDVEASKQINKHLASLMLMLLPHPAIFCLNDSCEHQHPIRHLFWYM